MELVQLKKRKYEFIHPELEGKFEYVALANYVGDTQLTKAPYVIDNLMGLESVELDEVFNENLMLDYINQHGAHRTLGDYQRAVTPQVHVEAVRLFITDVVSYMMNHNLSFVIQEYHGQEVKERWIKVPQTEVW